MAIMSAFQAEDESSIPSTRTRLAIINRNSTTLCECFYFLKTNKKPHQRVRFFIWYARRDSNSRPTGSKPATLIH